MSHNERTCFLIPGMHRSGTSLLSGLLDILGCEVGSDVMEARVDNPKGFFENNQVFFVNRDVFKSGNVRWNTFFFDLKQLDANAFQQHVTAARAVLDSEFSSARQFFIKDPRICLTFPVWETALKESGINIKCILPYRSPLEVAHSLKFRDALSMETSLMIWAHHFLQAERYSREYERIFVRYNDEFRELGALMEKLAVFMNIRLTDEHCHLASEFYTPSLKHHQFVFENDLLVVPHCIEQLIELANNSDFNNIELFDQIKRDFDASIRFYLHEKIAAGTINSKPPLR